MSEEHTERHHGGWQFVYWRGNTAATSKDADRVVLEQFTEGSGYFAVKEYRLPDDWDDVQKISAALKRAFSAGMKWRSQEIRHLLGIVE